MQSIGWVLSIYNLSQLLVGTLRGSHARLLTLSIPSHQQYHQALEPPGFISGVERVEGWSHKMAVKRPVAAIGRTGGGKADGGKNI